MAGTAIGVTDSLTKRLGEVMPVHATEQLLCPQLEFAGADGVRAIRELVVSLFALIPGTTVGGKGVFTDGIAITPDGAYTYVANAYNFVDVIDNASNTVIATVVGIGNNPQGLAINPEGTRAYLTNYASPFVSVIDTGNNKVVATVAVPIDSQGVAFNPRIQPSKADELNGSNCDGEYTGTYHGDLTVSDGQVCIFTNGGVTGSLTQTGGTLVLENNSFVRGDLKASGGSLSLIDSAIGTPRRSRER